MNEKIAGRRVDHLQLEGDYGISPTGELFAWPPLCKAERGLNTKWYSGPPLWFTDHDDGTISIHQDFPILWGDHQGDSMMLKRGVWMRTSLAIGEANEHGVFISMEVGS